MELLKNYEYLNSIVYRAGKLPISNDFKIDEFNLAGSRYSAKTTCTTIAIAKAIAISIANKVKVAVYAFRFLTRQVKELVEEIKIALDDLGVEYKYLKSDNLFSFFNNSFIKLYGVWSPTGRVSLKGLSKANDADLIIRWVEEANELSKHDFQNIDTAIRGGEKTEYVKISTCNPDLIYQDHIKYIDDLYSFNEMEMKTFNEQMAIIKRDNYKILNHYTNFKINPFLGEGIINVLEQIRINDPVRAKPWYYGLPGALAGSVFGNYLSSKRQTLDFRPELYTGGVDLGFAESPQGHPTTAVFVGMNGERSRYHVMNEYYHSNSEMYHKSPNEVAEDIVKFFSICIRTVKIEKLIVKVDYGAGGLVMIDTLNAISKKLGLDTKIEFIPVDKAIWLIKDRVEIFQIMLSNGSIGWSDEICSMLTKTMSLMKYKDPKNRESYKIEIIDLNDDMFDAMCYALMEYVKKSIDLMKQNMPIYNKKWGGK